MKSFITLLGILLFGNSIAQLPPANIVNGVNTLFQGHVTQTQGLVPGHVIRIEKPGSWVYENSAGNSSLNPATPVQPDMKFKVASITKMFTTVAIFKLIQEGQIQFDAPIGTYLPASMIQGFDDYENIKVKNLLSHTSGIREPQGEFQGRLNYWIFMKRYEEIPLDSLLFWSSGSSVGIGNYNYSNANFYLLAEIIKSVTGMSYEQHVTNTIFLPLNLANTDFNTIPNGSFMRGYLRGTFYETGSVPDGLDPDSLYDFTEASNSWGYGAADIWSNTSDLITFHKALFNGQLITSTWLDTMKAVLTITGDMGSYGHGMIQFNSYGGGPIYGFGHTGTAFGYGSMLCYIPSLDVYMCSAGNYMKIGQEFLQRDIYNFLANNLTSTSEVPEQMSVAIYPNPASNTLYVSTKSENFTASIYDHAGRLVVQTQNSREIDISSLHSGLYLIWFYDPQSNSTTNRKFVRE